MVTSYFDLDTVLREETQSPNILDEIETSYKGVKFHIYGILHGVTGGANREYRDMVRNTISQAQGIKMGEKGLKLPYPKIEVDLEDWAPMSFIDSFLLTLRVVCTPSAIGSIIYGAITEPQRKEDPYGKNGYGRLQDLGSSPRFHLVDPLVRRALVGFPSPEKYLHINLDRKRGLKSPEPIHFPDPNWAWLTTIEPVANISLRSLHMLEFATKTAQLMNKDEVSLFVGEIHNTDIHWLSENLYDNGIKGNWAKEDIKILNEVRKTAEDMANEVYKGDAMILRRAAYLSGLGLGASPIAAAACAAAVIL